MRTNTTWLSRVIVLVALGIAFAGAVLGDGGVDADQGDVLDVGQLPDGSRIVEAFKHRGQRLDGRAKIAPVAAAAEAADQSDAGELVGCEVLAAPGQAKLVRAGKSSAPEVTDGPFAEAKEFLAGYWIVDVDSPERAYALAGEVSAAPGPGGKPINMPIEVREVMSGPPEV